MKKLLVGFLAGVAALLLAATPASAATVENWTPAPKPGALNYLIDEGVAPDARNTVESSLEEAEISTSLTRYLYVAQLPEGTNVQTAARETAKNWGLDKEKDSLILYDSSSGNTFIWPATQSNVSETAALGSAISVDQFASNISSLFEGAVEQSDAKATAIFGVIGKIFGIMCWIIIPLFIFGALLSGLRYMRGY